MLKKIKHFFQGLMSWIHIFLKELTEKLQAKREGQRKILDELRAKKK